MNGWAGILAAAAVVAATVLAYRGSVTDEYVYDDVRFVERNPAVTRGAPFGTYFSDPATQTGDGTHEGLWRPLRTLSFRGVAALGGGARAQRITNLVLHLVNGLLVFLLLRRVAPGSRTAALIGTAAFLLHPAASEPVAWISGRGDLLATTGILGACVLWLAGGRAATAGALALFGVGLLAKESAAVVPLVLVALEWVRGGRRAVIRNLPRGAAFVGLLAAWLVIRAGVLGDEFAQGAGRGLEPGVLAATTPTTVLYYTRLLLLPVGLSFELRLPTASVAPFLAVLGSLVTVLLVFAAIRLRGRAPSLALAALWFGAALFPVTFLQVAFPLKSLVANRFLYPAIFAGALLLTAAASRGRRCAWLGVVVVLLLLPLTAGRARAFGSDELLWEDVLRRDPRNATALAGAGFLAAKAGDWPRATDLLRRASAADPGRPAVAATHGEALEHIASGLPTDSGKQRRYLRAALESYDRAIEAWQGGVVENRRLYRPTLANAAWLGVVTGRIDLAIAHARSLLESEDALPTAGRAGELFRSRLSALEEEFREGGEEEIAAGLALLGEIVEEGGDR